jgi:hypothetical protein
VEELEREAQVGVEPHCAAGGEVCLEERGKELYGECRLVCVWLAGDCIQPRLAAGSAPDEVVDKGHVEVELGEGVARLQVGRGSVREAREHGRR